MKTNKRVDVWDVKSAVCSYFNITADALTAKGNHAKVVLPRMVGMYLCRDIMGMTQLDIGKAFNRSYSSVQHALRVMNNNVQFSCPAGNHAVKLRRSLLDA